MQENNSCKGCTGTVRISKEEIYKIFGDTIKVKNIKLVTDEEYNERIENCVRCPSLDYGTTCRHCGCLIHIKAKLAGAKCPFPYEPKW